MIPEPSKLNWSSVKPTFEEVEGKIVIMVLDYHFDGTVDYKSRKIETPHDFDKLFDEYTIIDYAILDTTPPDPEPLPLWGELPKLNQCDSLWTGVYNEHGLYISLPFYRTHTEVINAWNKIAEVLAKGLNEPL